MVSLRARLALMQLADSALPTGAFSHSLGFEGYLDAGEIAGPEDFAAWLEMFVHAQLAATEAVIVREGYRARTPEEILDLDDLATAAALPAEVRRAGITMGTRLLSIAEQSEAGEWLSPYARAVREGRAYGHQSVAWALVCRQLEIPEEEAVAAHLHATVIALTQNAVRGIPLGQDAGQRIIARARRWVERATEASARRGREDIGAMPPGLEIAQMNHEAQRARMFMS
ncbi:urease accessory protein UreF [Corynebacterium sp. zg-331]|uniref:urease accessory protein UreF n=1 Tax=unclassified Corynebacterium TaxID=2624378 RepID=UPI00128BDE7C|nr:MULTISPECIES: urease accessory protein UreF [unclassified Corynebacterium]MBC3186727.1 urease accessory protein UreF [Corynebacterium sp. zg-331]MPV53209.1 urease accessory protein UreF [Corynebacterium sp. zg331]